jgi:hypothetical protein
VAWVFHLEALPPAGEHGPYPLRECGGFFGVQPRRRLANPQVVGALGDPPRIASVSLGERPPHPVHGDDLARLVEDSYVRGEAIQRLLQFLATLRLFLPGGLLALQRSEQLQPSDHRPGERPEHPHLLFAELDRPGAQQAEGTDGVPAGGDQWRPGVEADAVVHVPVLLSELFSSQEVLYDKRHIVVHHVLAHAVLEGVLPGFGFVRGQLSRPGPEVLNVSESKVDQTKVRAIHATHLVYQLLEDVVHPGPDRSQVFERRQAFYFTSVLAGRRGVELVFLDRWGHD